MTKEWRVVSASRRGIFLIFGEDETRARDFVTVKPRYFLGPKNETICRIERGGNIASDPTGEYYLQSRRSGIQGDDRTWTNEEIFHEREERTA